MARYTKAMVLAEWRSWFANRKDDAEYKRRIYDVFLAFDLSLGEIDVADEMLDDVMETSRRLILVAQSHCPLAFVKPSWEQAQVLNAWHPEFEPEIAPGGYQSLCDFTSNRRGKTAGFIFDTLLWILPNDPDWPIFAEQEDEEGRRHGNDRGNYRVFMRPDWSVWRRTGRLIYPGTSAPPREACEIWHGVENDNHWHDKVGKEYRKWMPKDFIGRRPDGTTAIYKQERRIETRFGHSITGKTYGSDVQDWAGKAVWRINMDEGFSKSIFDEALLRVEAGGYFTWAYTVAEARNIGERAKLAYDVFKGKHQLVGKTKFFTGFLMEYIPPWIMPAEKKADDIARLSKEGEMGKVRMGECPFASTSPNVFSNFDRERNVLPIDGPELLLAIRGEVVQRWRDDFGFMRAETLQAAFYEANIVRGFDEGLANPSACVWEAILRTGEWVAFREWEQSGLSVSERCEAIIDRSGNRRVLQNPGVIVERQRFKEERQTNGAGMVIRRTFADSKMFVRDELLPKDSWVENYTKAGLRMERAGNIGPAARCDFFNDMLRGDATRKHLVHAEGPGCRMYMTRDCMKLIERMENYLWAQIASGQRAGEFTDKPEAKDDHVIDAAAYVPISKLKWRDPQEQVGESVRYDSMTGAVIR